ncbi:cysteine desulfurase family protein [Consotaella aegiceratis]|uniref:cysteine desulfurase family protein n=1 Tax=Consotaella aegiceratis TaxID=3097961 RepID=UPI002F406397
MAAAPHRIYLDHNASAPLLPEARTALVNALDLVGNPSSVHQEGQAARAVVEEARRSVARLVNGKPAEVVFTSGASEAASTCLSPIWIEDGQEIELDRLAVIDTDHPAIRDGGRFALDRVTRLAVDADGLLRMDTLHAWLRTLPEPGRGMLAFTWANSETGVVQPLSAIVDVCREHGVILVVDAVQAAGRLPIDMAASGADALILSGHKIGAAKGVGAFVLSGKRRRPLPLVTGGGQEGYRRAGTPAVPLIASFGAAAGTAASRMPDADLRIRSLRDRLEAGLHRLSGRCLVLGGAAPRLANTLAVAYPGLRAETAQIALDLAGFAVSAGSACTSGKVGPSHVLAAMHAAGCPVDPKDGAIRLSLGYETTDEDIDAFVGAYEALIARTDKEASGRAAA